MSEHRDVDFVVLGLGAMGSAALYHLARRGVSVLGIEQFELGHSHGSSHGESRVFRPIYDDPLYVSLTQAALPLWRELEALSGEALLELCGWLGFAREERELLEARVGVLEQQGVPVDRLSPTQVAERFPQVRLAGDASACYIPDAGYLRPTRAVLTHISEARKHGAEVFERVEVHGLDLDSRQPELATAGGIIRAGRLIITAGPWTAGLLTELSLPLRVTRQQKFFFEPTGGERATLSGLPIYADVDRHYYGFPLEAGSVQAADGNLGNATSPDDVNRTLDDEEGQALLAWLADLLPGHSLRPTGGTTCLYTSTPAQEFVVGAHPRYPAALLAAGFSGHGFKFSTLIGRILSDLAIDGKTRYPIEGLAVKRLAGKGP